MKKSLVIISNLSSIISLISETKEAFDKFHSIIQARSETIEQKQLNEITPDQRSTALTQK